MTDISKETAIELLNDAYNAKANSLATYILTAEPYIAPGQEPFFDFVASIAKSDADIAAKLAQAIASLGGTAIHGTPDPFFAELNYLSIDYLASLLRTRMLSQLQTFETAASDVSGFLEAEEALSLLCSTTKKLLG